MNGLHWMLQRYVLLHLWRQWGLRWRDMMRKSRINTFYVPLQTE